MFAAWTKSPRFLYLDTSRENTRPVPGYVRQRSKDSRSLSRSLLPTIATKPCADELFYGSGQCVLGSRWRVPKFASNAAIARCYSSWLDGQRTPSSWSSRVHCLLGHDLHLRDAEDKISIVVLRCHFLVIDRGGGEGLLRGRRCYLLHVFVAIDIWEKIPASPPLPQQLYEVPLRWPC